MRISNTNRIPIKRDYIGITIKWFIRNIIVNATKTCVPRSSSKFMPFIFSEMLIFYKGHIEFHRIQI